MYLHYKYAHDFQTTKIQNKIYNNLQLCIQDVNLGRQQFKNMH